MTTNVIENIEGLFLRYGHRSYDTPVSALAHALQCAQLAEWADAKPALVAAALLHDIGHFIEKPAAGAGRAMPHEQRGLELLADDFGDDVLEPIRLHVQAKRYLAGLEPGYIDVLTQDSLRSLATQGGPMARDEASDFERQPYAHAAVALRRWDDRAKEPGKRTPPLAYYLALLDDVMQQPFVDSKIGIGSMSTA